MENHVVIMAGGGQSLLQLTVERFTEEKNNTLLICSLKEEQRIKEFSK